MVKGTAKLFDSDDSDWMSEEGSSIRASLPSQGAGNGSPAEMPLPGALPPLQPVSDNEPTVISKRPPAPPPEVSETARRILQGRIESGDRLGHFELVQYVGGGGMGRVFRANDMRLARTVALKILPPDQAADRETLLRFQNEAQSAARLNHDNIVRVYYVGEDQELHYIVFEFIEGVNVRELVQTKGQLTLAEAISYTLQVADALSHACNRNVVHRDIKPSNLLITPEGQVKLIDMGLARLREADSPDLTESGVTLGTFDYISPEQARDPRCVDVRSDVYSLGCTFFFMLTGQPPFPGGTVLQKLLHHQGDQPPDVRRLRPDLPDGVTRVLRKMLAKDPRRRYRDPAALIDDLLLLAKEEGLQPLGPGGRVWLPPREPTLSVVQRHLPWIVPAAALILMVLGLQWYWSYSNPDPTVVPPPEPPIEGYQPLVDTEPFAPGQVPGKRATRGGAEKRAAPSPIVALGPGGGAAAKSAPAAKTEGPGPGSGAKPDAPQGGTATTPGGEAGPDAPPGAKPKPGRPENAPPPPASVAGKPTGKHTGVLVVGEPLDGERSFSTLGEACRAAANDDAIVLRYNGRREEQPIKLANLRVTVRAAEGFQPVVVFRPSGAPAASGSMWTLVAGELALIHVAVEMHLPREAPAKAWSLLEVLGSQTVRLDRCSLSIHSAPDPPPTSHADAAFFRVKTPARGGGPTDKSAAEGASIKLDDCIARGDAVLLRCDDLQPARLAWNNGLLVTSERLLTIAGQPGPRHGEELVQLELRHLTAAVHDGMCRQEGGPGTPYPVPVQIQCTDSILSGGGTAALIEQLADCDLEDIQRRFTWTGDRNLYDGFEMFWVVRGLDAQLLSNPMPFDPWRFRWGLNRSWSQKVDWKTLPAARLPCSRHAPADYVLNETATNPAVGMASDGSNLGCRADRLPALPSELPLPKPETVPEKPAPEEPTPEKAVPENVVPDKVVPEKALPETPVPQGPASEPPNPEGVQSNSRG